MRSLLISGCVMALAVCACSAQEPGPGVEPRHFGVLQTDVARAKSNYDAGVRVTVLSVAWSRYQPEPGQFDPKYVSDLKDKLKAFRDAGMQVVLELGMQYPPAWVRALPGSRFVNQFSDEYNEDERPGTNGVNAVFNQKMRDLQAAYAADVFKQLGADFFAVRLGWGYYGELNMPDRKFNQKDNCYWAYDDFAQGRQPGLPAGMNRCPAPGFKPGDDNTDAARAFANWYMHALKNYHDWQIETVRRHYDGALAMMYPSWGIRPGQLDAAIAGNLSGSTPAERNGETQRAFDFARFIMGVRDPNLVVYTSWIDSNPEFGDDASADPARWSPVHYLADCAARNPLKLKVWGENTGRGDVKAMQLSFDRMRKYNLIGLVWAFEKDLYDTTGKYATLADYGRMIAEDHTRD